MRRRDWMLGAAAMAATPLGGRAAAAGPVVLELFTSQGCSSCPPADALLGELARSPGVIGLAWHVDYWNSPSWTDPYASAAFTRRQRLYAQRLQTFVYTPALVVNGARMVVGSDVAAVRAAIQAVPALPGAVSLRWNGQAVEASVTGLPEGAALLRVLYEPRAATKVRGGENAGRSLNEYRIVREALVLSQGTPITQWTGIAEGLGVVLLAEDASGRLIGAADLPPLG